MTAGTDGLDVVTKDPATDAEAEDESESDEGVAEPIDEQELPLDVVFDILKNRRRRLVFRRLLEGSGTSTLSDLAEYIAAVENDKPEDALTSSERKRVYVCLYQCHLPKMDDAGVVEFENNRGTVELANNTEQLARYLDTDDEEVAPDWPVYYLGLAGVGTATFVGQQFLYPSAMLTGVVVGLFLALFANLAFEHAYRRGVLPSSDRLQWLRSNPESDAATRS